MENFMVLFGVQVDLLLFLIVFGFGLGKFLFLLLFFLGGGFGMVLFFIVVMVFFGLDKLGVGCGFFYFMRELLGSIELMGSMNLIIYYNLE